MLYTFEVMKFRFVEFVDMRIVAIFLLCFISALTYGQSTLTISGKVLDKETGEPLIFATIGIKGESTSTVSNRLGQFDFHISRELVEKNLVVSMLGYENLETPINSLIGLDSVVLRMNRAVQLLDEVVISDSLSGGDIARIAINRIEENYPMKPFLMDGFYRDLKKVGGTYISLLEAAVKIYDEDYKTPNNKFRLRERVALMEVRKSLRYNHSLTRYFEKDNLLEDLLLHNNIRYRNFPTEEIFFSGFKRKESTYYDGHRVYVIEINDPAFMLKMFVDQNSYAIIRLEYERNFENETLKKKRDIVSKYVSDKKTMIFKLYQDKMYLNYMEVTSRINWYSSVTDSLKFETELHRELLINDIEPNREKRIHGTRKMKKYGLQYQDDEYNEEFWQSYNVIKKTPLDDAIIADLEQRGKLEKQFQE